MKTLDTVLTNALEDYFKQFKFDKITLTQIQEVYEIDLADLVWKALQASEAWYKQSAQKAKPINGISENKAKEIIKKFAEAMLGKTVGETINGIRNITATAKNYGFNLQFGVNKEPYFLDSLDLEVFKFETIMAYRLDKIK